MFILPPQNINKDWPQDLPTRGRHRIEHRWRQQPQIWQSAERNPRIQEVSEESVDDRKRSKTSVPYGWRKVCRDLAEVFKTRRDRSSTVTSSQKRLRCSGGNYLLIGYTNP